MEKQPRRLGMNDNVHALLTAAVGCYLAYIAYKVIAQPGDMARGLSIALGAFFGVAALAVFAYALIIFLRSRKKAAQAAAREKELSASSEDEPPVQAKQQD